MNSQTHSITPYDMRSVHRRLTLTLDELSGVTGLRPTVLRRLAAFAVIEAHSEPEGTLRFPISELPRLARGIRLRRDLGVGISSLGLVLDLLQRVDALETELNQLKTITKRPSR